MRSATPNWISRNATPDKNGQVVGWLFAMAALVAIMVVIGGVTRLTGSGLSMVEWRPLMGILPPLTADEWSRVYGLYRASPEYQQINHGMSLAEFKMIFFWEYFHRLWGRLLGIAFALPFIGFMVTGRIPQGFGMRLTCLFALGGLQGLIGWWMVKSGLTEDASVSQYRLAAHLGMALLIFSTLIWTALDLRDGCGTAPKGHALASLVLLAVTILAGALVAGMDAGLLYNEYPFMGSGLIPVEYGDQGLMDPFENPASAQFHHRWLALLTAGSVIALAIRARRTGWRLRGNIVLAAVAIQFILGVATLLHGVPVPLGGMHQAGAVLLLGALLALLHGMRGKPAKV
jgi:cytochrome c oxidase assembly protein subunit 15